MFSSTNEIRNTLSLPHPSGLTFHLNQCSFFVVAYIMKRPFCLETGIELKKNVGIVSLRVIWLKRSSAVSMIFSIL